MKIDLGCGAFLEPDDGPRDSLCHKRIVSSERIPGTRAGHWLTLECGHRAMAFGNLEHAAGVVLCNDCRDSDEAALLSGRFAFTCPDCGLTSYNPNDVANRYCGKCHRFHGDTR